MSRLKLIFGTTNSQPVGTPDNVVEKIYQDSYKPFLREVYNFPDIPFTLHYSGTLLEWLQDRHSEFIDVLAEIVGKRQIEILGGAFYDPVLSLIPRADALGQIESLTTLLRKLFGRRPRGSWITEQVWEPALASTLKASGMEYIFLDDHHFVTGGFRNGDLYRTVITEDQGKTVIVFPICHEFRDSVCNDSPESVIARLKKLHREDEERVIVAIYDGMIYGSSGESAKRCYDEKWLHNFFNLIRENREWLEPVSPWRYLRKSIPRTRAYFPSTSYEEMMFWALNPDQQKDLEGIRNKVGNGHATVGFMSGGFFRHFLTRYPESNLMYAKMQYTHILVNQLRGDKYRKQAAREELWKGQCNSAYWHGRPGGIYRNNLRKKVYASLIEAEKITRVSGVFIPSVVSVDFDMDGLNEYLYQGQDLNAYVHTQGALLFELDYLPSPRNYLDTLARRPEVYHTPDIARLGYDRYLRRSFMDHFFSAKATIDDFDRASYDDLGDFISLVFEVVRYSREGHDLTLLGHGKVKQGSKVYAVDVQKSYRFKGKTIQLATEIRNVSETPLKLLYGTELNFGFESAEVDDLRIYQKRKRGKPLEITPEKQEIAETEGFVFEDSGNRTMIDIALETPAQVWSLPVYTVSLSDAGFETHYQSSCVVPRWEVSLEPGALWKTRITLSLANLA